MLGLFGASSPSNPARLKLFAHSSAHGRCCAAASTSAFTPAPAAAAASAAVTPSNRKGVFPKTFDAHLRARPASVAPLAACERFLGVAPSACQQQATAPLALAAFNTSSSSSSVTAASRAFSSHAQTTAAAAAIALFQQQQFVAAMAPAWFTAELSRIEKQGGGATAMRESKADTSLAYIALLEKVFCSPPSSSSAPSPSMLSQPSGQASLTLSSSSSSLSSSGVFDAAATLRSQRLALARHLMRSFVSHPLTHDVIVQGATLVRIV